MKKIYIKKQRAFTLVELLVVIAIIGILATLSLVSFNVIRSKSRDAKRIADISQMQKALEIFFSDQGRYPTQEEWNSGVLEVENITYLNKIPEATLSKYCPNSYAYSPDISSSQYTINFCLENDRDILNSGLNFVRSEMPLSIDLDLLGWWKLDNNFSDSSGKNNHGTAYLVSFVDDKYGKEKATASFNGVDSKISISYINPVKETSVMAWFKRTGIPAGDHHIITGGSSVEISIYDPSGQIRTGVNTDSQGRRVFNSGSGLVDGNWHHVAMTYDGENLRSYIDGNITATNPVSGNLTGRAAEIGRYLSNTYVTNGYIDDVRIYGRALSSEEIKAVYNISK
jgi:prepilin-type N-terminal cleavage/methylation domain-containing protein